MHEFVGEIFLGEKLGNYQPPIPRKTSDGVRHRAGGMLAGLRGLERRHLGKEQATQFYQRPRACNVEKGTAVKIYLA